MKAGVETQTHDIESGVIFGAVYDDAVIASGEGEVLGLTVLAYDATAKKYVVCDPTADPTTSEATVPSCLVAVNGEVDATSSDRMTRILVKGEVDVDKIILGSGTIDDVKVILRDKGIILRKTTESRIV